MVILCVVCRGNEGKHKIRSMDEFSLLSHAARVFSLFLSTFTFFL